jgi:hemoglobin-like flavoprotein
MTIGSGDDGAAPVLAVPRPDTDVAHAVQVACQRLFADEARFVGAFHAALVPLVPGIMVTTQDGGQAVSEGLARAVLWAALTHDPPEVVEATLVGVGLEYGRQGFPDDGYHGVGHALLRAARETYSAEWSSELSSAWVAYYSWVGAYLSAGGRQSRHEQDEHLAPLPAGALASSASPSPEVPAPVDATPTAARFTDTEFTDTRFTDTGFTVGRPDSGGGADAVPPAASAGSPGDARGPAPRDRSFSGGWGQSPPAGLSLSTPRPTTGGTPSTLEEVLERLRTQYFTGNERALAAILTRVALRTGADLRAPRADQRADAAVIANVLAVLDVMGYRPGAGTGDQASPPPSTQRPPVARWWDRRRAGWRRAVPGLFR